MATEYARLTVLDDLRDDHNGELLYPLGTVLTGAIVGRENGLVRFQTNSGQMLTFREGTPQLQVETSETAFSPGT
jgi:hypothetical protein